MRPEKITEFIDRQLSDWKEAQENYDALSSIETRNIEIDGFNWTLQFNPRRIRSTVASVDKQSITQRKCFLCKGNRPSLQESVPLTEEFDMLVNPYPIFPVHFTIVHKEHIPQIKPPKNIKEIAKRLKGLVVFFNGAKSGASAPDHFHLQAVEKQRLPLIETVESIENKREGKNKVFINPETLKIEKHPFLFINGFLPSYADTKSTIGIIEKTLIDFNLNWDSTNCFFWIDEEDNFRLIVIPRKNHRPQCYFKEGLENILVSPGSIDLAGVIITPRKEDFEKLNSSSLKKIIEEVTFSGREI